MTETPPQQYSDDALYFVNASGSSSNNLFDRMDDPGGGKRGQGDISRLPQFTHQANEQWQHTRSRSRRGHTSLQPGQVNARQL